MDPFIIFGPDIFAYLKNIGVQIKEKITGTCKTAIGFGLFWKNTGPKKPVCEPSPYSRMSRWNGKLKTLSVTEQSDLGLHCLFVPLCSVSPSFKKGHGKVSKKRALSARGDMQRGHF